MERKTGISPKNAGVTVGVEPSWHNLKTRNSLALSPLLELGAYLAPRSSGWKGPPVHRSSPRGLILTSRPVTPSEVLGLL